MSRSKDGLRVLIKNVGETLEMTRQAAPGSAPLAYGLTLQSVVDHYAVILEGHLGGDFWQADPTELINLSHQARLLSMQGDLLGSLERSHVVLQELPLKLSHHALSALPGDAFPPDELPPPPWKTRR